MEDGRVGSISGVGELAVRLIAISATGQCEKTLRLDPRLVNDLLLFIFSCERTGERGRGIMN